MQNNDVLAPLSRLLSVENLRINRERTRTASFNLEKRILTLPIFEGLPFEVELMFVLHEVGHAIFTPGEYITVANSKPGMSKIINVVEDARIERAMHLKYPGCKKDFFIGIQAAYDFGFFDGVDPKRMGLVDRMNAYAKIGFIIKIDFLSEEQPFVDRMDKISTFEEAKQLAEDVWEFVQKNKEAKKNEPPKPKKEQPPQDVPPAQGEPEQSEEPDSGESPDTPDKAGADSPGETSDQSKEEGTETEGPSEDSGESESTESIEINVKTVGEEQDGTFQAVFNNQIEHHVYVSNNMVYFVTAKYKRDAIDFMPHQQTILLMKQKIDQIKEYGHLDENDYKGFLEKNTPVVNAMVREFEMRKAADIDRRSQVAKSGSINLNDLHRYKIADDIFRKYKIEATSTNHGFIILMDWSASMRGLMKGIIAQVLTLTSFCRRVGIKFEVVAFSSRGATKGNPMETTNSSELFVGTLMGQSPLIIQLLSSSMNRIEYSNACVTLFDSRVFKKRNTTLSNGFDKIELGNTTLNTSLCWVNSYLREFRARYQIQKLSLVVLSDGVDNTANWVDPVVRSDFLPAKNSKMFLRSMVTQKTYPITNVATDYQNTNTLLQLVKDDNPGLTLVGFFLVGRKNFRFSQTPFGCLFDSVECSEVSKAASKALNTSDYAVIPAGAYDAMYIFKSEYVDPDQLFSPVIDPNKKPKEQARQLAKDFAEMQKSTQRDRVVATLFTKLIA